MITTIVSIMMLAAFALVAGAFSLWRRGASRMQTALMLVVALVIVANVAIWIVPVGGSAPLTQQAPH